MLQSFTFKNTNEMFVESTATKISVAAPATALVFLVICVVLKFKLEPEKSFYRLQSDLMSRFM